MNKKLLDSHNSVDCNKKIKIINDNICCYKHNRSKILLEHQLKHENLLENKINTTDYAVDCGEFISKYREIHQVIYILHMQSN